VAPQGDLFRVCRSAEELVRIVSSDRPSDARFQRLAEVFEGALSRPEGERRAWLADVCGDAPDLLREVEHMLAAHARSGGILDLPSPATAADLLERLQDGLGDRYVVERELGRGGTATVFLAHERKHARPVVLKVLNPDVAAVWGADRFEREVHIAARLAHPHILGLIDSGEIDGLLFYVMPHVEGETLHDRLAREGPLRLHTTITLVQDIADALAYAHRAGVVHRDLKPANILCAGDHAYLMDFGVAKLLHPLPGHGMLTQRGAAIGTPAYMAPEQRHADPGVDSRADVYAWGLVAYEMLTGTLPRPGTAVSPVRTIRREVPAALSDLIDRCLTQDPDGRPADAEEVARGTRELTPGVYWGGRRTRWAVGAMGVVAAAAIIAAAALWRRDLGGAPPPASRSVAVAVLANETGDPQLDTWGRMAGDWITQGLQETGLMTVVPWPSSLQASERARAQRAAGGPGSIVSTLESETGAGIVVTGSFYLVGDRVRFQVEVTDAAGDSLLVAPAPVTVPVDSLESGVRELRERVMGALAVSRDPRFVAMPGLTQRPPNFEAYRAFDRGIEFNLAQEYRRSIGEFHRAYELDTTFVVAMLYAAIAYWNTANYGAADTALQVARRSRSSLSEYHDLLVQYFDALLTSDGQRALDVIRRASAIAPGARGNYNLAVAALSANLPREALTALEALDPDRGTMRGWSSYWTQLGHALHLLGEHRRELDAARSMRARYPDRSFGYILVVRALGALGRTTEIDSVLVAMSTVAPNTYWSQGAAMVVAGEELQAHGFRQEAGRYFERATHWLANQLVRDPEHRAHRYWLGSARYDAGRFAEAAPYFQALAREFPDRAEYRGWAAVTLARRGQPDEALRSLGDPPHYLPGSHSIFRARIAAIAGDGDRAFDLFSEALRQGVDGFPWVHASAFHDLEALRQDPRFDHVFGVTP